MRYWDSSSGDWFRNKASRFGVIGVVREAERLLDRMDIPGRLNEPGRLGFRETLKAQRTVSVSDIMGVQQTLNISQQVAK